MIEEIHSMKEKGLGMTALDLLSSPAGIRFLKGALKTKARFDRGIRGLRDFVGLPSYSDQDRAERSIARVQIRLRDLEGQMKGLNGALGTLEKTLEGPQERRLRAVLPPLRQRGARAMGEKESLTDLIGLLNPPRKGRSKKKRAVTKKDAAPRDAVKRKKKLAAQEPPPRRKKPPKSPPARSMLDINLAGK